MKRGFAVSCVLILGVIASAQPPKPQPAPELKNIAYFLGSWTLDGDMKPGPAGPGGKMAMHEHCEWLTPESFLVCHSDFAAGSMGSGSGLSVMGYNSSDKVYTYDEYNSFGEAEHSTGAFEGDTWTWTGDEKMGGQVIKGRFTMKILSPASYSFKYEMSPDGTNWANAMEG
ncbi:MAG: DUF1579 family protein, partial [Acidobacteriaceae bacterium]|nr:DUF1579 family protein [Acidobacteriaceae bacterium]